MNNKSAADIVRSYRMKMACQEDNALLEECAEAVESTDAADHAERVKEFDLWLTEKVEWAGGSKWAWQQVQEEFRRRFLGDTK